VTERNANAQMLLTGLALAAWHQLSAALPAPAAIAGYSACVSLDPQFHAGYYNRGLARERLGDPAAAADDYRRALMLDPMVELVRQRLERPRAQ
jgi:[acyl-carrier-protein] S-malonyltransferase